jgi:hypothetical protein
VRALAALVMRGRLAAAAVTGGFSGLSVLLAPLSYLGAAAIGLVTLRQGALEGLVVAALGAAAASVVTLLLVGSLAPLLGLALVLWLPVWLLGLVLRQRASAGVTVTAGTVLGILGVLGVHGLLEDPGAWWLALLERVLTPLLEPQAMKLDLASLERVTRLMTGLAAALSVLGALGSLLLARWWQALLFNPGGFAREFRELRVDPRFAAALLGVVVGGMVLGGRASLLAGDLTLVSLVPFLLQGLAVVHAVVALRRSGVGWLVGVYAVLLLLPGYGVLLVALVGFADVWSDFRRRAASS